MDFAKRVEKQEIMTKTQTLRNIVIALIFVVEPILFAFRFPVSVPLLFLKQTWPIQATIGFCLVLLGMTKTQALKAIVVTAVFVGETYLFTLSDRALAILMMLPMLTFPIQVFIGFYWVLLAPKISTWSIPRRIITIVIALVYCIGISISITFLLWEVEQIQTSVQLNGNRYYLTTKVKASGLGCDFYCNFTVPALYKCNSTGLRCDNIFHNDYIDVVKSGLVVDKKENEIQLFLSYSQMPHGGFYSEYELAYVDGKQPRFVMDSARFNNNIYYLVVQDYLATPAYYTTPQGDIPLTYMLYKCNQNSQDCERLPFEYASTITDVVELSIDDNGKLMVDNGELIYSFDIQQLQAECFTTSCQLKDK